MKREEFMPQFERLCKGFKLEPTIEQAEAWYRRIGHVGLAPWAEAVTTLLCAKYFPKLDEALEEVEQESERLRKAAVERDKVGARKTYVLTKTGEFPGINSVMFRAIRLYALRHACREHLARLAKTPEDDRSWPPRLVKQYTDQWTQEIARCEKELPDLLEQLSPEENRQLVAKYEAV